MSGALDRNVTQAIFLVACDYLRGDDSEYDVHDGLLWDMAVDMHKAVNAEVGKR
jgi:hypothetical protein